MGWFEEQIEQRKQYSEEAFEEAFYKLSDSITGKNVSKAMEDDAKKTRDAIASVLKYYGIKKIKEVPAEITDVNEKLDYLIRPEGMMTRVVRLTEGWYKDAYGPMLGFLADSGAAVALLLLAGGALILLCRPLVMQFMHYYVTVTDTVRSELSIMLLINSYYVIGQSVNSMLICGIFRAGGYVGVNFWPTIVGEPCTIDRVIDAFPAEQQNQVRTQLSMVLKAVVSQRLLQGTDGRLYPVFEVMTVNPAIQNLIREGKTHQIDNAISGAGSEMLSMDSELARLAREEKITKEMARAYALHPETMERQMRFGTMGR